MTAHFHDRTSPAHDDGPDGRIIGAAEVRGRPARAFWFHGLVEGDPELCRRIAAAAGQRSNSRELQCTSIEFLRSLRAIGGRVLSASDRG